jgi:hypothetical protein
VLPQTAIANASNRDATGWRLVVSTNAQPRALEVISAAGTHVLIHTGIDYVSPVWSPDGRAVAFARTGLHRGLYVIRTDTLGARPTRVALGRVGAISWSPDGRRIAFARECGPPCRDGTYIVAASGGIARFVLSTASRLAWAPDGSTLVCRCGRGLTFVRRDGALDHRVVDAAAGGMPSWSPDGRLVTAGNTMTSAAAQVGGTPRAIHAGDERVLARACGSSVRLLREVPDARVDCVGGSDMRWRSVPRARYYSPGSWTTLSL